MSTVTKTYTISDSTVGSFTFTANYDPENESITGTGVFTPAGSSTSYNFNQLTGVYELDTKGGWSETMTQTQKKKSCLMIYATNKEFGAPWGPYYSITVGGTVYSSTKAATISLSTANNSVLQ